MTVSTPAPSPAPAPIPTPRVAAMKTAGRNTLLIMGMVLLSRVLGVGRDWVISRLFGQNQEADIYTAAFRVPDILYLLVAGGALAAVFVPVFKQYFDETDPDKQKEAWRVFSSVMTVVAIAAAVMVIAMEFAVVPVTRLLSSKFSEEDIQATAALSRILLPAQWCFFVGGLMMGVLNARERFLIPALGPVIYNLSIIGGAVLLHQQFGIASLAIGALAGALMGNFLLPLWEHVRTGSRYGFSLDLTHPGVRTFWRNMLPALIGLSLSQLTFSITQYFLPPDGSISVLRNAYNMTQAPIGVFAQAFAIVLFPTITALALRGEWETFRDEISHGVRRILFLTIPASLLMATLALPVFYLYVNDKVGPRQFGEAEAQRAAAALLCYSIATFAWSAQSVFARAFYAMQNTKTPAIITTSMVGLFTLLCVGADYFLSGQSQKMVLALALITSFISTLNMLIFLGILHRRLGGLNLGGMARSASLILLAALGASGAAYSASLPLLQALPHNLTGGAVTLVVAGGVGVVVYTGLCFALRVPELLTIRQMFRRKS